MAFYGDIGGFVALMGSSTHNLQDGLERAAKLVEDTAKAELGHYQTGWPMLAASTEERKARAGAPSDAPLIREGDMQDAFQHHVHGSTATIENTDPAALIQELGAGHTPPRPFLSLALFREKAEIEKILGQEFILSFTHPRS